MLKILRSLPSLVMGIATVACSPTAKEETANEVKPPVAEKVQKELVANGNTRVDNYYWMQLTDAQKNAGQKDEQTTKVVNYLTSENNYLASKMKHTEALQEKLFKEITGRIKQTDESVPYKDNGYWYYTRYEEGQEYPIYCRKKGTLDGKEEVLLNVNEMAKGHNYYSIRGLRVSEDNNLLAYAEDSVSRRRYTLYVKDLRSNKLVENPIPNTEGYV